MAGLVEVVVSDGAMDAAHEERNMSVAESWAEAEAKRAATPRPRTGPKATPAVSATARRSKPPTRSRAILESAKGILATGPSSLSYVLPGRPVTWKRAGGRGKRRFNPPEHRAAKRAHAAAFDKALGRQPWPIAGRFAASILGVYPDAKHGDLDKLIGMVFDALEGRAWGKDRKVVELLEPTKIVVDRINPPHVLVTITRLGSVGRK